MEPILIVIIAMLILPLSTVVVLLSIYFMMGFYLWLLSYTEDTVIEEQPPYLFASVNSISNSKDDDFFSLPIATQVHY